MNNYRAGEEVNLLNSDEDDPPDDSSIEISNLEDLVSNFEIKETIHSSDYMLNTVISTNYYDNNDYLSETTTSANTYYEKNEYDSYSSSSTSIKLEDIKEYLGPQDYTSSNITDEIESDMFALTGLSFEAIST